MKILHLDTNHKLLIDQLADAGFQNDEDYTSSIEIQMGKRHPQTDVLSNLHLEYQCIWF